MSSLFTPAVQIQEACLGASLARIVTEYYQDKQHRKEFETWYKKTYGKPYVWKKE